MSTEIAARAFPRCGRVSFGATLVALLFLPGVATGTGGGAAGEGTGRPRAIISLSPNVTEMLDGIGAFERVIAVSDYCSYPPQVRALPRVGGWLNTDLEKLAGLRPDLVIMTDDQAAFVKDRLDSLGLRTLVVPSQTLADVFKAMAEIGAAVGNVREAQALETRTRAELERIRSETRGQARPRVLCVVDRLPGTLRDLYAATRGSYLSELIEIAGGDAIVPPSAANYVLLSPEALLGLDPDVILDLGQGPMTPVIGGGAQSGDPHAAWADLPQLRAVRDRRVYALPDRAAIHASQFVSATARKIAELLHQPGLSR